LYLLAKVAPTLQTITGLSKPTRTDSTRHNGFSNHSAVWCS